MDPLTILVEKDAIRELKAKYYRCIDQKRWKEWRQLFTEDLIAIFEGLIPETRYNGPDELVLGVSNQLADSATVHHGHTYEIEITSPTTAKGVWPMFDYMRLPDIAVQGYGYYWEEYRKEDGRWKIAKLRLTRLHRDILSGTFVQRPKATEVYVPKKHPAEHPGW